ncbi:MAG: hypothetical protein Q8S04_05310 [Bacteroidales bacterium]|nr:hypothetical protein [Bacteroidales bacterium]
MTRIKLFKLTAALIFLAITISCSQDEKSARASAGAFLDSYFKIDYERAAGYCTSELGEELRSSLKSIETLESGVKEMIIKQTSAIKSEITKVEHGPGRDSMVVVYRVILSGFPNGIENRLVLVKSGKDWKVAQLGK